MLKKWSDLSRGTTDKFLRLVYEQNAAAAHKSSKTVLSQLYNQKLPEKSALDDLKAHEWNQKPLLQAVSDLPKRETAVKSNILTLRSRNSLLTPADFYSVYPTVRERLYRLPDELKIGIKFTAVKARDPGTLSFRGKYHLVFGSYTEAAAYWMETKNKQVNGMPLNLDFTPVTAECLAGMVSPYLADSVLDGSHNKASDKETPYQSGLINKIIASDIESSYPLLQQLINYDLRASSVLVKNLPIGLSKHTLPRLLWDYDFPKSLPVADCIKPLAQNSLTQTSVMVIRFADHQNALRFVSSFHGTRWHGLESSHTKRLYETILCELLD